MRQVYFDHQAGTPVLPEVFEAMRPFFSEAFGSPSSLHRYGLSARDALARAREQTAALIQAESPEEIIFTSGGTEAANLAVKGAAEAGSRYGRHILVSAIEHPAVLRSVEWLENRGFTCTRVKVDGEGMLTASDVADAITDETILICLHHANHDIGTIEPVREVAQVAASRGIPLFVDATASAGWMPIDVRALGVSLLSLAPHRFYGPKGVGVLYRDRRARLQAQLHGGVQEGGRRAGTENVPAIVGAGAAAAVAGRELPRRQAHAAELQRRLWEGIQGKIEYVRLNGPRPGPRRLCTNLNVSFEFVEGEGVALMADTQGVAVASGAACVSKALKVSPVLTAIRLDHSLAQGNVIFSLGQDNTVEEVDYAVETISRVVAKLRDLSPAWDDFQRGLVDSIIAPRTPQP